MSKYLFFHPLNLFRVFREIFSYKPDLIITHNSIPGLAAILAKKVTKIPVVIDMTDLIFEYLSYHNKRIWSYQLQKTGLRLENYVLQESDKISNVSDVLPEPKNGRSEEPRVIYVDIAFFCSTTESISHACFSCVN